MRATTTLELDGRRAALRRLLRQPLTLQKDAPEIFSLIARHRQELGDWFAEALGWKLVVEPAAGFARLHKVPARPDGTRGARPSGRPAFDRRRYVLLCLTLAALDEGPAQTTLAHIAQLVTERSQEDPSLGRFEPKEQSERRAFVDVLRWLVERGVLTFQDGDTERYVQGAQGDALYRVNDRILAQLLSAPRPPTLVPAPTALTEEIYPQTEDGRRQEARHQVLRALLDDPVVYLDDLPPAQRDWLLHTRHDLLDKLLREQAGLVLERRREGVAVVDPAGEVSDVLFPDGQSTARHAALLLCEHLCARARPDPERVFSIDELQKVLERLIADVGERCGWSAQYRAGAEGAALLLQDSLAVLAAFRLIRAAPGGIVARPALARFAPEEPQAVSASKQPRRATGDKRRVGRRVGDG